MELLNDRSRKNPNLPRAYAMKTFFLPRLERKGYNAVRRWTRNLKSDIFTYQKIIIPYNQESHWCLIIINMDQKTIVHYDSPGHTSFKIIALVKAYLQAEHLEKRHLGGYLTDWTSKLLAPPSALNDYVCGVFICTYADAAALGQTATFQHWDILHHQKQLLCEISAGEMYIQSIFKTMRPSGISDEASSAKQRKRLRNKA